MEFKLNNSTLRTFREEDAESIAKNGNNIAIFNNMRDVFPNPYTIEHGKSWITMNLQPSPNIVRAIDVDGKAVGCISLLPKDDISRLTAEIGYWLGEAYWGKGIMTEAVKRVVDYAFENTEFVRIYGIVFSPNKASAAVLENAGFRFESTQRKAIFKNGEILDALVYAMVK
jgi:[ribosomal protein S5]-alanine N-acetyltransferase